MIQLYPWQVATATRQTDILRERSIAFNASGTGIGKTYMAAASAAAFGLPVLCVPPKSVLTTWRSILEEAGVPEAHVLNWEKLKTTRYGFWEGSCWRFDREYFVILDEVHQGMTGPDSQITAMAAKLRAYPSMPKLLMSATLADSPLQLRALGYLLGLHNFSEADFYAWCLRTGCERVRRPNGRGAFVSVIEMPRDRKRATDTMLRLRQQLEPFMVRLTSDNAPGFPDTEIMAKCFDLGQSGTAEVRKLYAEIAAKHHTNSDDVRAQLVKARQRTEVLKVPVLAELAKALVAEGKSAVVFLNFHEPMDLLARELGGNVVQIRGGQSDTDRSRSIELFQSNAVPVCVAQTQAGGVAVSLHDVTGTRPRASLLCPDWDAKRMVQCLGRIHRAGGTKTIQMFVLAAGTLEEKVKRSLDRKRNNIDTLNDGDLIGL